MTERMEDGWSCLGPEPLRKPSLSRSDGVSIAVAMRCDGKPPSGPASPPIVPAVRDFCKVGGLEDPGGSSTRSLSDLMRSLAMQPPS